MLGLTPDQLMTLVGIGVALVVLLFVFRALLRLTRTIMRFGCLGIVVILAVAYVLMQRLGG